MVRKVIIYRLAPGKNTEGRKVIISFVVLTSIYVNVTILPLH